MATTFSVNYKNVLLNLLTGYTAGNSGTNVPYYVMPYTTPQPADPLTAITTQTSPVPSYSYAPQSGTYLTSAANGISSLTMARGSTAAQTTAVSGLTWCRILGSSGTAIMDTTVSLSGGGGGAILDTLNTSAGIAFNLTAFSIKLPQSNGGTVYFNQALTDYMVNVITGAGSITTSPTMGVNTNGASVITIYSGTAPANADAPQTNTALVSYTMGTQVFAAAAAGSAALTSALTTAAAGNTGTATHFRWVKTFGGSSFIIQGTVGTSGTDMIINTTSIVATNTYTISNLTLSI